MRPVFEGLKHWHIFTNLYLALYGGRRIVFGFFIAILQYGDHWARTIVIFILQVIYFVMVIILWPY